MSNSAKAWLIVAASLVCSGLIAFAIVMSINHWDFTKLDTSKYETNNYEITDNFNSISINTDTASIQFVPSNDGICRVTCVEQEKMKHSVTVKDDTLVIEILDTRKWYEHISFFSFKSAKITISLPESEYASLVIKESTGNIEIPKDYKFKSIDISASTGDIKSCASASELIKIKTSTGDICVENVSTGSLDLSVSTGKVTVSDVRCEGDVTVGVSTGKAYLTNVACKNVTSSGSTGDISLKNVIATESFSIKRSTGNIKFDGCDAGEIFVETDTGDVTGTLLTEKIFIPKSDTGDIKLPETTSGGKCKITTDTGDIKISIQNN